ncbi:hypothetical protein WA577_002291, partial [Blastocystis sp. JDR]
MQSDSSTQADIEMKNIAPADEELPTIPEESTSSDMRSDIPAIAFPQNTKAGSASSTSIGKNLSRSQSSFYGLGARQSSVLGEDPLFSDHDPVALIGIARQGTMGHTLSSSRLAKTLTTITEPQVPVGIPFIKRLTSPAAIGALIGTLLAIIVMFIPLDPENKLIQRCAGVLIIMATFWISEVVPLSVTALFPLVLFPLLNIAKAKDVATQYFNDVIFLFFAGFLMSLAMEKWHLDMRIALSIMKFFSKPSSMLFGIMLVSAFLSIFVSNTAAAVMMVNTCKALVESLETRFGKKKVAGFAKSIFLGIAFATAIGGIPTLISSPPNMIFLKDFKERFTAEGTPMLSFSNWLIATLPMSLVLLVCAWGILCFMYCPSSRQLKIDRTYCIEEHKKLGKMSYEEIVVALGFVALSLLWLFRADLAFGSSFRIPGWANLFEGGSSAISDSTVGMFVVLVLFFVPTKKAIKGEPIDNPDDSFILTWGTAKRLPWDLILLFGGGFALALGSETSGLTTWIGNKMKLLQGMNIYVVVLIMSVAMVIIGVFTSNTACATIMIPVVTGVALQSGFNPLTLLFPVTCCCSVAFLLPSSTPPNLIAYTSNTFTTSNLLVSGAILSVICIVLFEINTFTIFPWVIGYDPMEFPEWAKA